MPTNPECDETYLGVETLYIQRSPRDEALLDFMCKGAFANVRHVYLGEPTDAMDVNDIVTFLTSFEKLQNIFTMLPRYCSHASKIKLIKGIVDVCPEVQRICLTRRRDARDVQCFAYGVVSPPTCKDYIVTRVRHHHQQLPQQHQQQQQEPPAPPAINSEDAAAFARCTLSCLNPPYATKALYMFKHV